MVRARRWLPWALAAVVPICLVAAFGLSAGTGGSSATTILVPILILAFAGTGTLIASRLPENSIGWLFLALADLTAVASVFERYARRELATGPLSAAGSASAVAADLLEGPLLILVIGIVIVVFPDGRLPLAPWRRPTQIAIAAGAACSMASMFEHRVLNAVPVDNPLGVTGAAAPVIGAVNAIGYIALIALIVGGAVSLIRRFRRATGDLRLQLKWFGSAAALLAVSFLVAPLLWASHAAWSDVAWVVLFFAGAVAIPLATCIAVLRYRLYEIDVLIRKTLVYGALTVILGTAYLIGVAGAGWLLRTVTGASGGLAVTVSTLAVVVAFRPLRARLQAAVDRRFYRARYDAARALGAFGARLRVETDLAKIGDGVLSTLHDTVRPTHASLWLRTVTIPERREGTTEMR